MLKMAHISAVALAGLVAFSAPAAAKAAHRADATETVQETERVDRTVQIRAGGQLRLKNFSGRVVITGSRRGDVAIHAVRHATRDRLDHIKLEIRETASGISIEANKKAGDSVTWDQVKLYLKPTSNLYTTGKSVIGDSYATSFKVDGTIGTPSGTSAALSDVAPAEFWSPYTLQ